MLSGASVPREGLGVPAHSPAPLACPLSIALLHPNFQRSLGVSPVEEDPLARLSCSASPGLAPKGSGGVPDRQLQPAKEA